MKITMAILHRHADVMNAIETPWRQVEASAVPPMQPVVCDGHKQTPPKEDAIIEHGTATSHAAFRESSVLLLVGAPDTVRLFHCNRSQVSTSTTTYTVTPAARTSPQAGPSIGAV